MRKVLFIMTLLMTMLSQGAWAQSTTTRTVTTAEGSGGTDWTIPTSADEGQPVTVTYTGQHRVKSVRVRGIAKLTCDNTAISFAKADVVNSTKTKVNVSAFGGTPKVSCSNTSCTASYANGTITITRKTAEAFNCVITVSVTPTDDNFVWKPINDVTFNVSGIAVHAAGDVSIVSLNLHNNNYYNYVKLYTSATTGYYIYLEDDWYNFHQTDFKWNEATGDNGVVYQSIPFTCGTKAQWEAIMSACGGTGFNCINTKCNGLTGWVAMTSDDFLDGYWTSTASGTVNAHYFKADSWGTASQGAKKRYRKIRPFSE